MTPRATLLPFALLACAACAVGAEGGVAAGKAVHPAHPVGHYASLESLPDWGGVWVLDRRRSSTSTPEPRLKGEYLRRYRAWQQESRDNNGMVRRETSNCMPPGMPAMMASGQYPMEFLFTPGKVTTHHEAWMQWRTIYTDGRGHPDDWEGGIFGHSIGHWEGDTLVVETIGIKTITTIQHGIHHSPQLKVTERFRLSPDDPDILLLDQRLEDPEALEEPWDRHFEYRRHRDWELMEFICAENDRNPVDPDGHTRFE